MNNNTPQHTDDIHLPQSLPRKSQYGPPSKYTPQLAQAILADIATTPNTIEQCCNDHGIDKHTWYAWMSVSADINNAMQRACAAKATVYAHEMALETAEMDILMQNQDIDPRYLNNRSTWYDKKWRWRTWLMERWNRRLYGNKLDIDQTVTVNPSELREQAWRLARDAEITDYNPDSSD